MRRFRLAVLALVLVVVSQPLFARGCVQCHYTGFCLNELEPGFKCRPTIDGCIDTFFPCGGTLMAPLGEEWQLASVEVLHESERVVRVDDRVEVASRPAVNH